MRRVAFWDRLNVDDSNPGESVLVINVSECGRLVRGECAGVARLRAAWIHE